MRITVPVGVAPPSLLEVQYDAGAMFLELATVTGVSLAVTRPDGTTATWACVITGASQSAISFSHAWAAGDCPSTGDYTCVPSFTVPGGVVPGVAFYVYVQQAGRLQGEVQL